MLEVNGQANAGLEVCVAILREGGVIACPTETHFGLLADAQNARAVERVAAIKGRPTGDPIAVLVPSADAIHSLARPFSPAAVELAAKYWPGPLTIVTWAMLGASPLLVRDGKIGLRVPGPSPALDVVRLFGGPLTATSANRSGHPAAITDADVRATLGGAVDFIVPGRAPGGRSSTLVDVTAKPFRVLRPGPTVV